MEAMRESWTDGRLDDLSQHMDERFNRVEADLQGLRSELHIEAGGIRTELNARFDSLQSTLISLQSTLIHIGGGLLAAFGAALIGLVATQL